MKRTVQILLAIGISAALFVVMNVEDGLSSNAHTVEMSVSRLTCGSCVEKINVAVTDLDGINSVETDVAAARSRVIFNPEKVAAERIAETISSAGYPATILAVRDQQGTMVAGMDTGKLVARIGARVIERETLNHFLQERIRAAESAGQPVALKSVYSDAWRSLLSRQLLLNASEQFGVVVDDVKLDERVAREKVSGAAQRDRLREDLLVEAYLDQQYQGRQPNVIEMNNLLNKLYANTTVDIFDNDLKRYLSTSNSGGCGGSCCG